MLDDASDLQGMKTLEDTYRKFPFPQDTNGTAFSSTCLYWRPKACDVRNEDTEKANTAEDESGEQPENETADESKDKSEDKTDDKSNCKTKDWDDTCDEGVGSEIRSGE